MLAKTAFFVAGGIKVSIPMSTGVFLKPRREEAAAGPCAPPENRAVLSIRCGARSISRGPLEIVRGMPTRKKKRESDSIRTELEWKRRYGQVYVYRADVPIRLRAQRARAAAALFD